MSHRIVGLDIGSYSVKVLRIETRFRSQQVVDFEEELVVLSPPAADPGLAPEATEVERKGLLAWSFASFERLKTPACST